MSYEEDKRDAVPGFEEDYEPEQQTLDVWMDLPEPESGLPGPHKAS